MSLLQRHHFHSLAIQSNSVFNTCCNRCHRNLDGPIPLCETGHYSLIHADWDLDQTWSNKSRTHCFLRHTQQCNCFLFSFSLFNCHLLSASVALLSYFPVNPKNKNTAVCSNRNSKYLFEWCILFLLCVVQSYYFPTKWQKKIALNIISQIQFIMSLMTSQARMRIVTLAFVRKKFLSSSQWQEAAIFLNNGLIQCSEFASP